MPVSKFAKNFPVIWPKLVSQVDKVFTFDTPQERVNLLACIAATIDIECPTWVPCSEMAASKSKNPKLWALQQRYWNTGYYGRGLPQLTWRANYAAFATYMGMPEIMRSPDLLLDPDMSVAAMVWFFKKDERLEKYAKQGLLREVRKAYNGSATDKLALMIDSFNKYVSFQDNK